MVPKVMGVKYFSKNLTVRMSIATRNVRRPDSRRPAGSTRRIPNGHLGDARAIKKLANAGTVT